MVKLQIDLGEEEDKIVSIYKIEHKLETKEQAVKELIQKSKKCEHKFEVIEKEKGIGRNTIIQRCINCGVIRRDAIYNNGIIETYFSKK
jgi:hypothetical protein